jgi:hypothetical protein
VVAVRDVQHRVRLLRVRGKIHQEPLVASQRPGRLEYRGDRHADDPVLILESPQHPFRFRVQLWTIGIGRSVALDRGVLGERILHDLRVVPLPEPGRVARVPPLNSPLVRVGVAARTVGVIRVVAVGPPDGGEQEILVQRPLQLVRVAAAVGVVMSRGGNVHDLPHPGRKLGSETDLQGAAVRLLVVQRQKNTVPVLHWLAPWIRLTG